MKAGYKVRRGRKGEETAPAVAATFNIPVGGWDIEVKFGDHQF